MNMAKVTKQHPALTALLGSHAGSMKKDFTHNYSDGFREGLKLGFYAGRNHPKEDKESIPPPTPEPTKDVELLKKTTRVREAIEGLENSLFIPAFNRYISFEDLQKYFEQHPEAFEYREDI